MPDPTHNLITNCAIHGYGAADSGEYPKIRCTFDMVCYRETGSPIVTWDSQLWQWEHFGNIYGYKIAAAIAIDPDDPHNPRDLASDDPANELWYILEKPEDYPSENWWYYVTEYHPGPRTFNCPKDTATMYVYVKSRDDCTNNGHFCFNDPYTWTIVAVYTLQVPTYSTSYTVSYNGQGGTPVPDSQTKSSLDRLQLSSVTPTLSITVNYYNAGTSSPSATYHPNRAWLNAKLWTSSSDSALYNPGDYYSTNANTTMTAYWGNATFTTIAIPDKTVRVTYNATGGTVSPGYTDINRQILGYSTSSSASTATYAVGETIHTASDMNLYPVYGGATLIYNTLPKPTRSGYKFDAWYRDSALTQRVTGNITNITSNMTLYAKWIALPVHQMQRNGTWNNQGPYVWQMGSDHQWHQVAHVYKREGSSWTDLSE
jgi:uncharacterized repeat protein (TIGR02543 family)